MKIWKILLVAALATLAIGLVVATAFVSAVRPGITPYGTSKGVADPYGGYAGVMTRGGMMGNGYLPYSGYGSGANGYGGCMGARGWP